MTSSFYRDIINLQSTTSEFNIDCLEERFEQDLFNPSVPNYYVVNKNFDLVTEYKCIIQDASAIKKDLSEKKIVMYPYQSINKGDVVHWKTDTDYWICIKTDKQYDYQEKGLLKECNDFARFIDKYEVSHSLPCVIAGKNEISEHIAESQNIRIANNQIAFITQWNDESRLLEQDTRLIFGSRVFEITVIDDYSNVNETGYLYIILTQDEKNNSSDDFDTKIAWNDWQTNEYAVNITNGSDIDITSGNTTQLDVVVTEKGNTVLKDVNYYSSDVGIVTVDASGLVTAVSNGSATIEAKLDSNEAISDSITINVTAVVGDNYNIILDGDGVVEESSYVLLYKGNNSTFDIEEFNNNVLVVETYTNIIADTSIVGITSNNVANSNITLEPLAFGTTTLTIEDGASHVKVYTIEVKSLWG